MGWLREYRPGEAEKFLTTYHQRDQKTGLDYRGARFYDSDVGRFLSLDPLAEKFAFANPYNYVLGNPVYYTDPDGKEIRIHLSGHQTDAEGNYILDENGNKIETSGYITYEPGMDYTGNNFADATIMSLNHLYATGADVTGVICNLVGNPDAVVDIYRNNPKNNPHYRNDKYSHYFNTNGASKDGNPWVNFDPLRGLAFMDKENSSFWTTKYGYRSPAEALLHELGHAQSWFENPGQHMADSKLDKNWKWGMIEERDNVRDVENPAAKVLRPNSYVERTYWGGQMIDVKSPLSIE